MLDLNNKVGYYETCRTTKSNKSMTLEEALSEIKNGRHFDMVTNARLCLDNNDGDGYNKEKMKLPLYLFAGVSSAEKRSADRMESVTGDMIIDLDSATKTNDIPNMDAGDAEYLKGLLIDNVPFIKAAFISTSGRGVKILVKLSEGTLDKDYYKQIYKAVKVEIEAALTNAVGDGYLPDYKYDTSGQDISRLCFTSIDDQLYTNFDCEAFTVPPFESNNKGTLDMTTTEVERMMDSVRDAADEVMIPSPSKVINNNNIPALKNGYRMRNNSRDFESMIDALPSTREDLERLQADMKRKEREDGVTPNDIWDLQPYDLHIRVGMALKRETGRFELFEYFGERCRWNRDTSDWNTGSARRKTDWDGFDSEGDITIGTLKLLAESSGWRFEYYTPNIDVSDKGDYDDTLTKIEAAIIDWNIGVNGEPVLYRTPNNNDGEGSALVKVEGSSTRHLTANQIWRHLHTISNLYSRDSGGKSYKKKTPVPSISTYFQTEAPEGLNELRGVSTYPLFNGEELVMKSGYDSTSGFYFNLDERNIDINQFETTDDALEALRDLFCDMPFVDSNSDLTNTLGMLFTLICRPAINNIPMFIITKSGKGDGASLIVKTLYRIVAGRTPSPMTSPPDASEWRKTLFAEMKKNVDILFFDDLADYKVFGNKILAAVLLSDGTWTGRELGVSKTYAVNSNVVIFGTGTGITYNSDLRRRVVEVTVNRISEVSPMLYVPEGGWRHDLTSPNPESMNPKYLSAALRLVNSWVEAGCPPAKRNMSSFETFTQIVGGILEYHGLEGFLDDYIERAEQDEEIGLDAMYEIIIDAQSEYSDTNYYMPKKDLWNMLDTRNAVGDDKAKRTEMKDALMWNTDSYRGFARMVSNFENKRASVGDYGVCFLRNRTEKTNNKQLNLKRQVPYIRIENVKGEPIINNKDDVSPFIRSGIEL